MSLIEALIALTIASILMAAAFPMYTTWVQNTQIRTGAEAILNGLQIARSEALSRNTNVQFALTGSDTGWQVNEASDPDGTPIQARSGASGSATAKATPTPADATVVTFDPLGRRRATNIVGGSVIQSILIEPTATTVTDARRLQVTISSGGQVRMCDPDPAIPTGDTRRC